MFLMQFVNKLVKYQIYITYLGRYSVDPGDLDIPVGCVFRALPGTLTRDEVDVERLDQLDGVLQLQDNEELVSHIIRIFPTQPEAKIQVRIHLLSSKQYFFNVSSQKAPC